MSYFVEHKVDLTNGKRGVSVFYLNEEGRKLLSGLRDATRRIQNLSTQVGILAHLVKEPELIEHFENLIMLRLPDNKSVRQWAFMAEIEASRLFSAAAWTAWRNLLDTGKIEKRGQSWYRKVQ